MKILISGGHLTPALAFIDYLQAQQTGDQLIFAGRLVSQEATGQLAREKIEVEKRGLTFIPFQGPKLSKTVTWLRHLTLPYRLLKSIWQAKQILKKIQPDIFLSFGGYLAVPLALACRQQGIPFVTHEQTRSSGLANQILARSADRVAVSWPETKNQFPVQKTVVTGNPVRQVVLQTVNHSPQWFTDKDTKPILLVMGGSQGSKVINQVIHKSIDSLCQTWTVIHLTGQKKDYPVKQPRPGYYRLEWLSGRTLAWLYTQAQLAVARAGANTCLELTLRQIPTLYIPLPFARGQEQLKNAQALVAQKAAQILTQDKLEPTNLLKELKKMQSHRSQYQQQLAKIQPSTEAAAQLYQLLKHVVHES